MSESEAFARWQQRHLDARTGVINLFITLSLATIGFIINALVDNNKLQLTDDCAKYCIYWGCIFLGLCLVTLFILTLNRLSSFRWTAQIARNVGDENKELRGILRTRVDLKDKISLYLFNIGIILFIIGEAIVVLGFYIHLRPLFK